MSDKIEVQNLTGRLVRLHPAGYAPSYVENGEKCILTGAYVAEARLAMVNYEKFVEVKASKPKPAAAAAAKPAAKTASAVEEALQAKAAATAKAKAEA